jgi:aspartate racemase
LHNRPAGTARQSSAHQRKAKPLGIVGGLGPESTIEYYRQLVSGYRERVADGSYPSLIIYSTDVNRVLKLAAENREKLVEYLLTALLPLARAGADFALIAANTPHIVFDAVARKSPIPLLSIVEATCAFAKEHRLKNLGLFGTRSTMEGGFYQEVFAREGIRLTYPGPEEQTYIHEKYVGELVNGRFLPETRAGLVAIAHRLKGDDGIDGLILGGTELPLLLSDNAGLEIPFLDTTRIHVDAALERMLS